MRSRRSRRHLVIGLAALCLVLTAACSDEQETGGADREQSGNAGAQGEPAAAGVEEFHPDDVLAAQTVAMPTRPEDEVTVGVLSLRVEGDVMVLRLAITPHFTSVDDTDEVSLFEILQRTSFAPVLIDMEHLKEYSVISETGQGWTSGSARTRTANGTPMLAWAVFAAPEDDIDTINLRVTDWWPPFTDVPIER